MLSWEIIKKIIVTREGPGTTGRLIQLNQAAALYSYLEPLLKDRKLSSEMFNADTEVTDALTTPVKAIKAMLDRGDIG